MVSSLLITVAVATASTVCTWSVPAAELGDRALLASGTSWRAAHLSPSDEEVVADLRYEPGTETMSATFRGEHLVVYADLEVEEMRYTGPPLAWGVYGTILPGAAVYLVEKEGDSVVIVPKIILSPIVRVTGDVRVAVACEVISPSSVERRADPTDAPDDGELVHAAMGLAASPGGERGLMLRGTEHNPLAVRRVGEVGEWKQYAVEDVWGTAWTGWSRDSRLDAPKMYWRQEREAQVAHTLSGGSGRSLDSAGLVCSQPVRLTARGALVAEVLPGGVLYKVGADRALPKADWVSLTNGATVSSLESCVEEE